MTKTKTKRNLAYTPHLITYIDILGFRELVEKRSPNFISYAIRQVIEATEPDRKIRETNQENYIKFSDLIVHTVPILSPSNQKFPDGIVFHEIHGLALAQATLVEEGLLLRGAVTLGMLERSYGVVFGPGIIAAYDLEREQAQFPRIVIEPGLFDALKDSPLLRLHSTYEEEMKFISSFVKRDDDGVIFIDYLGGMQDECDHPADYFDFLEKHKKFVEKNLAKFKESKRVLYKYRWLKKYHNAVVQTRLKPGYYEEFLVDEPGSPLQVLPLSPLIRPEPSESSNEDS